MTTAQVSILIASIVALAGLIGTVWRLGTLAGTFAQKVDGLAKSIDGLRADFETARGESADIATRLAHLEGRCESNDGCPSTLHAVPAGT